METDPARASDPADLRERLVPWWSPVVMAVVLGLALAGLSSSVTSMQRPAGPVLCAGDRFLTGNEVDRVGRDTLSDVRASCGRADGTVDPLPQWQVLGVLTVVYALPVGAVLAVWAVVLRRLLGRSLPTPAPAPLVR